MLGREGAPVNGEMPWAMGVFKIQTPPRCLTGLNRVET